MIGREVRLRAARSPANPESPFLIRIIEMKMLRKKTAPNTTKPKFVSERGSGKNTRKPSPTHTHVRGGAVMRPRGSKSPLDKR
jgi:hypothetical protein